MPIQIVDHIPIIPLQLISTTVPGPNFNLNTTAYKVASCIALGPGETISAIGVPVVSAVGTPGVRVSVQSCKTNDASAALTPSGSLIATNTSGEANITNANANNMVWINLTAAYTNPSSTDPVFVWLVVDHGASGNDFSGSHSLIVQYGYLSGHTSGNPTSASFNGTWATANGYPCITARNASGNLVGATWPVPLTSSDGNWSAASTPRWRGNIWYPDASYRMSRVAIFLRTQAKTDFNVEVFIQRASTGNYSKISTVPVIANLHWFLTVGIYMGQFPIASTQVNPGDNVITMISPQAAYDATNNNLNQFPVMNFESSAERLKFTNGVNIRGYTGTWNGSTAFTSPTDATTKLYPVIPMVDQIITPPRIFASL